MLALRHRISLVLLVGAGIFLRSSSRGSQSIPGFGREPAAILTPVTRFSSGEARIYTRRLLDRYRELPGADAVGAISRLHLNPLSTGTSGFNVAGFEPPTITTPSSPAGPTSAPDFSRRPDTQPVAIVSGAMARHFWEDGDAVGRLVGRRDDDDPPGLVVGAASDAKVRTLGEAPREVVCLPLLEAARGFHDGRGEGAGRLGPDPTRAPDHRA